MNSVAKWEKYSSQIAAAKDMEQFLWRDFSFMVDYLALRFRTGDLTYRDLFVGEKIRQAFFEKDSSIDAQIERRRQIVESDARGLLALFRDKLSEHEHKDLEAELSEIARILTTRAARSVEVLLIGDCLFLDVTAFLAGPALEDGISMNPTLVSTRNPVELRSTLHQLGDRKFDLIFYSPFTYEFAPEYNRLMEWRQSACSTRAVHALSGSAIGNVIKTLDVLVDRFDGNIFVHNSIHIRRHDSSLKERVKNLLTWRVRRAGRRFINARLDEYIRHNHGINSGNLRLFNEMDLLRLHGETQLGKVFYDHDSRHPAAMGKWVSLRYRDLLAVQAHLLRKKLIVCDLDETLWQGAIGEGSVRHHIDRQRILKTLKSKGVLLAINSKNDPINVKWDGGVLHADDFVHSQINWDSKVTNIQRIAHHLNLKGKDFIFIDDRPDERAMVHMAMPEVHVLDATADRSWHLLDLWSQMLADEDGTDRTQLYKEKNAREDFLQSQLSAGEEEGERHLFEKLDLVVTLREAKKSDLKRAAELINRTNQFNTCASRVSMRDVSAFHGSEDHRILIIDCEDKFGTMGTVSVCVVRKKPDRVEIPVFVLSCRVFGYGIEKVVVNAAKRLARDLDLPLTGLCEESAYNEPSRTVYPENGFVQGGSAWHWRGDGPIEDPPWLKVQLQASP